MGFKRPFDDEEFQDLPFKQARQVDYCNKLTQFSETGAHSYMPLKPDITGNIFGLNLTSFSTTVNMVLCSLLKCLCGLV
jgi:hypothetical protein